MSLTKVTYSMIVGSETSILDYIPVVEHDAILNGTSTYNCGPDILAAINTLNGLTKVKALYFPKGTYIVNTQIDINDLQGFKIYGDGIRASILKYVPDTGAMFYIISWVNNVISNIGFTTPSATLTNVCFRLNGQAGGTELTVNECRFENFGKVATTLDATQNEDTVTWNNCSFWYNKYVWDNSNSQAVSWVFNDCQVVGSTGTVFNNPAGFLRVVGGTYINQGTLCHIDIIDAFGVEFNSLKLETTQNFNPVGAPKWLTIGGTSFIQVFFTRCNDNGGGSYAGEVFNLKNYFDVTFDECDFGNGYMTILANTVDLVSGVAGTLTANNSSIPMIVETVYPANDNLPSNKVFINSTVDNGTYTGNFQGSINRLFSTRSFGVPVAPALQKLFIKNSAIGVATTGFEFYVPIVQGGALTISNLDFLYTDSSGSTATITLYTDITKAVTIYSYSKGGTPGVKVDTKSITGLTTIHTMSSLSSRLYIEVVPAGDIGSPIISLILTLTPFY